VESQRTGASRWEPVKLNDSFSAGDTIRVGKQSRADLALLDQSVLRLNEDTTITLQPVKPERTGVLDLLRGAVHFFSRGPRSLEVKTEFVAAGVRGTEFYIRVEADSALVTVFEGTVLAESPRGSLTLIGGQSAVAERGTGPVLRSVVRPRDAVRWTLYYPPVLYLRPDEIPADAGWAGPTRQSLEAYRRGDLKAAFDAIAGVPATVSDPRFLTYRAQLSLAVGRVDEAAADLERALAVAPGDAGALSLQAIAAVVQNDKERALGLARKAVEAAPRSATAHVALSYAQQARFDLEGARSSLERAVQVDPQNALAWARLAELHSSFGDRGKALDAARTATSLAPDLSRTQTVLGFAYLTDVKVARAKETFEKAIALDSADPLPRLGLGLARIREGDLDRGAREIEIAASLDPSNALIRSYLGKTYYEEKRTGLDEREYAMAKELDPLDPTPWFYDAIAKQTTNRPVEALHDLDRAIELNDNRAIYRSRLLLDADLAARSASLARIYSDLGFQQLALVEGWKSVETDPTSDSAHRLLADSYSALPRHEVARVSELLQAQLLQPINITPIQPRLAESNLFLLSQGGPGALSFNEFNPLFSHDRLALQLSGLGAEHSTYGVEPVVSGVYRNLSASAGYSRFKTDGFRVNDDQRDDIANAFVQAELTSQTSVLAEYRHRETVTGDLTSHFFLDEVRQPLRTDSNQNSIRAGVRHVLAPSSTLLATAMYQKFDFHLSDRDVDPVVQAIDVIQDHQEFGGEVQHLFRSRLFDLVSGAGFFDLSGKDTTAQTLALPPPPDGPGTITVPGQTKPGSRHGNAYAYANVRLPLRLTLTLGLSGDFLRTDAVGDTKQVNPKLGATWSPFGGTTVRAAVFRALKRTLVADQTVEPTQVAGFNQFFDDVQITRSWRYGLAVDQKVARDVFVGAEGSGRNLTVPLQVVNLDGTSSFRDTDMREYLARGYAFWTPLEWVAARAEYSFERLSRDADRQAFGAAQANTHRAQIGARAFHRSGLTASAAATYYNQTGFFGQQSPFTAGSDRFWVVDVGLGYRLPGRYGLVSIAATNLLDQKFNFFENGINNTNPTVQPGRTVLGRVTLAVP
jgi:tetratricopeptide (TPR) repeat protein